MINSIIKFAFSAIITLLAIVGFITLITPKPEIESVQVNLTGVAMEHMIYQHRKSKGLHPLELDGRLCNNISKRWHHASVNDNHDGFKEWLKEEIWDHVSYKEINELFVTEATDEQNALEAWISSPGHRTSLEGNYTHYCLYANKDVVVLMLAR
jgi:hypothetical protein